MYYKYMTNTVVSKGKTAKAHEIKKVNQLENQLHSPQKRDSCCRGGGGGGGGGMVMEEKKRFHVVLLKGPSGQIKSA
jgi:hypothetical protein